MTRIILNQIVLVFITAQCLCNGGLHVAPRFEHPPEWNNSATPALAESRPQPVARIDSPHESNRRPGTTEHRCTTCKQLKDESAFSASWLRKKSKICRDCKSGYNRRWYAENKAKHMADVRRNSERYRQRNGAILLELKSRPCVDCGTTFHPMAMEFDHVRGFKEQDISILIKRTTSLVRFLEEVAKCDLVCANCHRVRTAGRMQATGKRVYWNPGGNRPRDDAPPGVHQVSRGGSPGGGGWFSSSWTSR